MVYAERAETAAVLCGTSHVSAVSRLHHFGGYSKTCSRADSLLYKSDQQTTNKQQSSVICPLCCLLFVPCVVYYLSSVLFFVICPLCWLLFDLCFVCYAFSALFYLLFVLSVVCYLSSVLFAICSLFLCVCVYCFFYVSSVLFVINFVLRVLGQFCITAFQTPSVVSETESHPHSLSQTCSASQQGQNAAHLILHGHPG